MFFYTPNICRLILYFRPCLCQWWRNVLSRRVCAPVFLVCVCVFIYLESCWAKRKGKEADDLSTVNNKPIWPPCFCVSSFFRKVERNFFFPHPNFHFPQQHIKTNGFFFFFFNKFPSRLFFWLKKRKRDAQSNFIEMIFFFFLWGGFLCWLSCVTQIHSGERFLQLPRPSSTDNFVFQKMFFFFFFSVYQLLYTEFCFPILCECLRSSSSRRDPFSHTTGKHIGHTEGRERDEVVTSSNNRKKI